MLHPFDPAALCVALSDEKAAGVSRSFAILVVKMNCSEIRYDISADLDGCRARKSPLRSNRISNTARCVVKPWTIFVRFARVCAASGLLVFPNLSSV